MRTQQTKTGKTMYVTEMDGKTVASFDKVAIEAYEARLPVQTKPGSGNWIFVSVPKGYTLPANTPTQTAVASYPINSPQNDLPYSTNGNNVIKDKLLQIKAGLEADLLGLDSVIKAL